MPKKIFVLGNETDSVDKTAVELSKYIQKKFPQISFVRFDPTEDLEDIDLKNLVILDVVKGLKKIEVFKSFDNFVLSPRFTAHDFDAVLALRLLMKLGKVKKMTIIGVPIRNFKKNLSSIFRVISSI